jgi:5'(3')-deoxyribonucleotidase
MNIILIDCDGVMVDFSLKAMEVANEEFGISLKINDGKNWDFFEYPECREIKDQLWTKMFNTSGIIYDIPKFSYTDELLFKLRSLPDTRVIACTALVVSPTYASERAQALVDKMGFDREDIIITHSKEFCYGDVLIDDRCRNLTKWRDRWVGKLPVLWHAPNREFATADERLVRAGSVNELMELVNNFIT